MSKWEAKEKRMEDIVTAAFEIFLEKGYEGTSMEAIASKAQISKGGLYHHFSSKDEILYYANAKLSEPVDNFLRQAAEQDNPVDGLRFYIRHYIGHWMAHQRELSFFFLTLTKAISCPETWPNYGDYYDNLIGTIAGLYEKGVANRQFSSHRSRSRATTLVAALDGILAYLVMNEKLSEAEIIGDFEDQFIDAILVR